MPASHQPASNQPGNVCCCVLFPLSRPCSKISVDNVSNTTTFELLCFLSTFKAMFSISVDRVSATSSQAAASQFQPETSQPAASQQSVSSQSATNQCQPVGRQPAASQQPTWKRLLLKLEHTATFELLCFLSTGTQPAASQFRAENSWLAARRGRRRRCNEEGEGNPRGAGGAQTRLLPRVPRFLGRCEAEGGGGRRNSGYQAEGTEGRQRCRSGVAEGRRTR